MLVSTVRYWMPPTLETTKKANTNQVLRKNQARVPSVPSSPEVAKRMHQRHGKTKKAKLETTRNIKHQNEYQIILSMDYGSSAANSCRLFK